VADTGAEREHLAKTVSRTGARRLIRWRGVTRATLYPARAIAAVRDSVSSARQTRERTGSIVRGP